MKIAKGAELALVLAFGATLVMQANGAPPLSPQPAPPPAAAPTAEQIEAAVALAERQADRVNGPSR